MGGIRGVWNGPGGDDHLVGLVGAVAQLDHEAAVARGADGEDLAVELDRQVEALARSS